MNICGYFTLLTGLGLALTGAKDSQRLVDAQLGIQDHEGPPEWDEKMDFRQSVVEPMGSQVIKYESSYFRYDFSNLFYYFKS